MFRLWGKLVLENHSIQDTVICDDSNATRTEKVFKGIEKICHEFDLGVPVWFESNVSDFRIFSTVRFREENFMELVDFEYLEIRVLEEDE